MNLDLYSDRAKQAVQSAQSLALARRHQQFAPEHLLKVLLEERDGLARNLIQSRLTKEQMYIFKLISPTDAEALSKAPRVPKGHPKKPAPLPATAWKALQPLIIRGDSKPQIVLDTDPRPALNKAEGFEDVPTPTEEMAALFGGL